MPREKKGSPNVYRGIKQVDGTANGFSSALFENGYLYLVRTSTNGNEGYIYLNGKKYGSFQLLDNIITEEKIKDENITERKIKDGNITERKIKDGNITEQKLSNDAVTEDKIKDGSVAVHKLSEFVQSHLLTDEMIEYLKSAMSDKIQSEAQGKLNGYTIKPENASYVYGVQTPSLSHLTVRVGVMFDGTSVDVDAPNGWAKLDHEYVYVMSVNDETVPSCKFTYTIENGKYSGLTVSYDSEPAELTRLYPSFYGFVPSTDLPDTLSRIGSLYYTVKDVDKDAVYFENTTEDNGYFCIITRGTASLTQTGVSILREPQDIVGFPSVYNGAPMVGYKIYFSKNTVAKNRKLISVKINIKKD